MYSQSQNRGGVSVLLGALALVAFCGCSLFPQPIHHVSSSTRIEQMIYAPYQPFRTVQICLDTPPLYPVRYSHEAAASLADAIDALVNVNMAGMDIFTSLITHNSYQEDVLQFSVPAFPADPVPPSKPAQGDNPYDNATARETYAAAFATWQATIITRHHHLAMVRAQVTQETQKLRTLVPPYDNTGADIYGCLDDAAQHFQGVPGEKILFIASPLINNTALQATNTISLAGASVRVIWHTCQIASVCQRNDAVWKAVFIHDGARDVHFYDPAQEEASPVLF